LSHVLVFGGRGRFMIYFVLIYDCVASGRVGTNSLDTTNALILGRGRTEALAFFLSLSPRCRRPTAPF
jgi:hypothetical protein